MRWERWNPDREPWRVWFAWHPINFRGTDTVVWLERVERRKQVACDWTYYWTYYDYRPLPAPPPEAQ